MDLNNLSFIVGCMLAIMLATIAIILLVIAVVKIFRKNNSFEKYYKIHIRNMDRQKEDQKDDEY